MNHYTPCTDSTPLAQTQRERLAFIDYKVFFSGELRRSDLETRFGIAPAAATRDLSTYRQLVPNNLTYDTSAKIYTIGPDFKPAFHFAVERALAWLRRGYGDGLILKLNNLIPTDGADLLAPPNIDILGTLTRSIHQAAPLAIRYHSLSSGVSEREIVPLALVDNGLRWHVRAYDRKRSQFRDFVINRIASAKPAKKPITKEEMLTADDQWNRHIELKLVPHPGVAYPQAIVADYAMNNGVLLVQTRAAMAGYALARWNVDCSASHTLPFNRHHLWLSNHEVLHDVESALLAPGYSKKEQS